MTLLILLASIATALTFCMFYTRNMMLGFPSGMFWAIAGGQAYEIHTTSWDICYDLFFASFGMTIFCIYAAFGLRKADMDKGWMDEEEFVDEGDQRRKTEELDDSFDDDFKEYDQFYPSNNRRGKNVRVRSNR